jgi:hypothetical protein
MPRIFRFRVYRWLLYVLFLFVIYRLIGYIMHSLDLMFDFKLIKSYIPRRPKSVNQPMQQLLLTNVYHGAYSTRNQYINQLKTCSKDNSNLLNINNDNKIAIVMADSRSYSNLLKEYLFPEFGYNERPFEFSSPSSSSGPNYDFSLTFILNLIYSTQTGNDLIYYEYLQQDENRLREGVKNVDVDDSQTAGKQNPCCYHEKEGWRSSPWCKLLALSHTMDIRANKPLQGQKWEGIETVGSVKKNSNNEAQLRRCSLAESFSSSTTDCPLYEYILFLDSDSAIVSNLTISQMYRELIIGGMDDQAGGSDIYLNNDGPFEPTLPNSGLIFIKNTAKAREFLRVWWDSHIPYFNQRNTYEQHPLWSPDKGGLDYYNKYKDEYKLALIRNIPCVNTELWEECVKYHDKRRFYQMGFDWGDECSYATRINSPIIHFAHIFRADLENGFTTEVLIQLRRRLEQIHNNRGNCVDNNLLINNKKFHHFKLDGFLYKMI